MEAPLPDNIDAQLEAALAAAEKPAEEVTATVTEDPGITAKAMALAEELNAARLAALTEQRQQDPIPERPTLIEVAAQGMDALHEAIKANSNRPTQEYIPPPRTARQMSALEEELEAGRRANARAQRESDIAAEWRAKAAAEDRAKEGFTTPVHRPNDVVPNPMGGVGNFLREG